MTFHNLPINDTILILSGSYAQAREFAFTHLPLSQKWDWLSSREKIMGRHGGIFVRVGTWQDREDIEEILERIQIQQMMEIKTNI